MKASDGAKDPASKPEVLTDLAMRAGRDSQSKAPNKLLQHCLPTEKSRYTSENHYSRTQSDSPRSQYKGLKLKDAKT